MGDTLSGVEAKTHDNTRGDKLADEGQNIGETLCVVDPDGLVNRLPDSLAEVKVKTLSQTLVDVEGEALVNVLGDTLAGVELETNSNTVGEEEAKAEVETLFDTKAKWRPRHLVTHWAKWRQTHASGDAGPHRLPHTDRCVKSKPLPTRWLTCNQERRPRHLQANLRRFLVTLITATGTGRD